MDKNSSNLLKVVTIMALTYASVMLCEGHLYLMMILFMVLASLFPIAYVMLKFRLSDCINKPFIVESGMSDDTVMMFKDGSKIRTGDFIEREIAKSNMWLVMVSIVMAHIGIICK